MLHYLTQPCPNCEHEVEIAVRVIGHRSIPSGETSSAEPGYLELDIESYPDRCPTCQDDFEPQDLTAADQEAIRAAVDEYWAGRSAVVDS